MAPRGRPKKKKGFRVKVNNNDEIADDIDFKVISDVRETSRPLGLLNNGENVCFFNSVIQLLYSIKPFRECVQQTVSDVGSVIAMKELFMKMDQCKDPIRSSAYILSFNLVDYEFGRQYDAHECLMQLLDLFYPVNNGKIADECIFKISTFQSVLCNCQYSIDQSKETLDLQVNFEDSDTAEKLSDVIYRMLNNPHGVPLPDYTCEKCNNLNTSTKSFSVINTPSYMILQLCIFKYDRINGIVRKIAPRITIDDEMHMWGNSISLHAVIYHEGQECNSGHYTAAIKTDDQWFLTNDSHVTNIGKVTTTHRESVVPYILVYKKRNNLLIPLHTTPFTENIDASNSSILSHPSEDVSNVTYIAENEKCPMESYSDEVIELVSDPEVMNRYSILKELDIQKERIKCATKVTDKDFNFVKRKRRYGNLCKISKADSKRKKDNLEKMDDDAKTKLHESEKKRLKEHRKNMDDDAKTKLHEHDKNKKKDNRKNKEAQKVEAFNTVKEMSMVDPRILHSDAYKIIKKEFEDAIKEGPTNTCDICFKQEYRSNVIKLDPTKYEDEIFDMCEQGKYEWICKGCHRALSRNKMPAQAQANNLELCPIYPELECLCPIEVMLISQIIPFMFIVAKHKGAQQGLKGQCVLVPADLKKIQTVLPRSCNDEELISLALKRRLSDTSVVNKQNIRPALVNRALQKLIDINPFYKDIRIDDTWAHLSEQSDHELWNLLTDGNVKEQNNLTDSDDNIEGNDHAFEKQKRMSSVPFPTALQNIDGPSISPDEIINIAPGEGQVPVSVTSELNWEALAFAKEYSTGKKHFNESREVSITPSKYVHARLKCCDSRFASNPQYIFHALDWIEKTAVSSSIHFTERKQFQSDINAGKLLSSDNVRHMISEDQIFASFKNIRGTPQYFHNMMLDVLAKIRQFGVSTFFLTMSAAEFQWTDIIKIVARQYGETLSTEQVNEMDWSTKAKYLKRNPVTVARQIDYIFRQAFGKIIYSGMHPIGEILNHDDRREFQSRGAEHVHASIHVVNAPKIDENEDIEVEEFIDKYITCSLPNENDFCELNNLVKTLQTHHHTVTCRKKKGVTCRFNAPWAPSQKTSIIRGNVQEDKLKESKKIVDTVLQEISCRQDLSDVTLPDILRACNVQNNKYENALKTCQKKLSIIYRRRPFEKDISPYNTVILSLVKSNMNIQFVTGVYGLLTYLTSYLCKPEHTMSELMKKASKEASGKDIKGKLRCVGNVFLTKREVSTHEAIIRVLSLPMRTSNIDTIYIATGLKKNRTRILKPQNVLESMDPEDTNVYATNITDKYANRPDSLEDMCYADFATNYVHNKAKEAQVESDDIKTYTMPVSAIDEVEPSSNIIVLKNELGEMRKRVRPCVMRYHKVSKMNDPEQYYLVLLQLYMRWRNEDEIKGDSHSYKEKFDSVELAIKHNILKHDPYFGQHEINPDDLLDSFTNSDSDSDEYDTEFGMINADLLDLDLEEDSGTNNDIPVASTSSVQIECIPRETFYEMCSQLNENQQLLVNYIMKYAIQCVLSERNDKPLPEPFHIFLSGGAGVGKSFLVNLITEYLKKVLRYPNQNWDEQPSVIVTASTGKAATNINGTTLHSAFHLPVTTGGALNKRLSNEKLHMLRVKYKFLKVLLSDEISMTGKGTFDELNKTLQLIMNNNIDFGGVSVLVIGDFMQLPPVKQKAIYDSLRINDAWNLFTLHELNEIVRQSGDPQFAQLLNRLREGNHTFSDVNEIKALAATDTSIWPSDYAKLYVTNALVNKENEECLKKLQQNGQQILTVLAKDSKTDVHTGSCNINIDESTPISNTGNLPKTLKVCVGARIMLTENKDLSDRLINGLMGRVKHISRVRNNKYASGVIYIKFEDPNAGNKLKDKRLRGELKECVPIQPVGKRFPFKQSRGNVIVERKQFPLILAHAITIHKSQGSTLEFMRGDLNQTSKNASRSVNIGVGMLYTLLSRAKTRDKLQLVNFKEKHIKVNKGAVDEMKRMRSECMLSWSHPLKEMTGINVCLFNIRSWDLHIAHFLSDEIYSTHSSVFCFTETHVSDGAYSGIENYLDCWSTIHRATEHGLAICYDASKVEIIEEFHLHDVLQLLPVLLKIQDEHVLFILVYRPPGSVGTFIQVLISQLSRLPIDKYRTLILGDFNLDQMLRENIQMLAPLISHFSVSQRSHFSTHVQGGILDLVMDNRQSDSVEWMPSPYSDHFVILISL